MVARRAHNPEVEGSNPSPAIFNILFEMENSCEKQKFFIYNLGCPKNEVDGHLWSKYLIEQNFAHSDNPFDADILLVNTCAFIEDARRESAEAISQLLRIKAKFPWKKVLITGCWAQKDGERLLEMFPQVDGILGNADIGSAAKALREIIVNSGKKVHIPDSFAPWYPNLTVEHKGSYAFLKIADGCDNFCSYCLLPYIKGRYRSIPEDVLVKQAEFFVKSGTRELVLIAQDTTVYGKDIGGDIISLLRKLNDIEGDFIIRLMYAHPRGVDEKLVRTIVELPKVVNYLDIPLQHYDSQILSRMNRGYDSEYIDSLIEMIFSIAPDMTLRTTFIVGFPGEFDEHFEKLYDFVTKGYFTHLGVFQYSREENTPAYSMDAQVPPDVASLRKEQLEMAHDSISCERNNELVGKVVDVLVDSPALRDGFVIGRMRQDAPQVDRIVRIKGELKVGEWAKVRIIRSFSHEFLGVAEE